MSYSEQNIPHINDIFRASQYGEGRVIISKGITQLGEKFRKQVLEAVRFSPAYVNNANRDMGKFEVRDVVCIWQIDYLNKELTGGSTDIADPSKTMRVLSIMLPEEYFPA